MTLVEKVAQLGGVMPFRLLGPDGLDRSLLDEHIEHGIGQVSMATMLATDDPAPLPLLLNGIQEYLVNETRLGIPAIAHNEALSGLMQLRAADYPTAMALAATWDPQLVEWVAGVARDQMRALGIHQALSPVLDVARDARWGRVHETYGEDPYLVSAIGTAYVRGLQTGDLSQGVLATAKHFLGYGASEAGRNLAAVSLSYAELYEVYARPFEAAVREAGLGSVMNSYSELNGEPPAVSVSVLSDLLRDDLGFEGFVVSDYWAIDQVATRHHAALDRQDAGVQALEAGLDVELPEQSCYGERLIDAAERGLIAQATIDRSVRRVLRAKFLLGLFENPYADVTAWASVSSRPQDRDLAAEVARRSLVLLKNDDNLLPLSPTVGSIAVIGPSAHSVRNLFGAYTPAAGIEMNAALASSNVLDRITEDFANMAELLSGFSKVTETAPEEVLEDVRASYPRTATVLDAITSIVSDSTEVLYAKGCEINSASTDGIAEAVAATRAADVAVVVIGDKTGWAFDSTSGEGRDRSSLELPGAQAQLLDAVVATGTPVVAVLLNSRPMPVGIGERAPDAVLEAWLPGSIGGGPIASVLFGDASPTGKLPITVPRSAGQCPIFAGHRAGSGYKADGFGEGHAYTDLDRGPAYPFGFGLSYTTFSYDRLEVGSTEVPTDGAAQVSVTVSNTGRRQGEEVVQVYMRQRVRRVTRPVLELMAFERVALGPGETATLEFRIPIELLAHVDAEGVLTVEPGRVEVFSGPSSAELPLVDEFRISAPQQIMRHRRAFFSTCTCR